MWLWLFNKYISKFSKISFSKYWFKEKIQKKEIEAMKKNEFIQNVMMQRCIEHSFFNVNEDYISVKKIAEKMEKDGIFEEEQLNTKKTNG